MEPLPFAVEPATAERWPDLERLFGRAGGYGGCWCMYWRLPRKEFGKGSAANREALERAVAADAVPGLLGYLDGEPVGWVSLGPREAFLPLARSPKLGPVDDEPVWSLVCFVVRKDLRGQGLQGLLLDGAIAWARAQGARVLEAYPTAVPEGGLSGYQGFMGLEPAFLAAGFREVARRGGRGIFRLVL